MEVYLDVAEKVAEILRKVLKADVAIDEIAELGKPSHAILFIINGAAYALIRARFEKALLSGSDTPEKILAIEVAMSYISDEVRNG